MPVDPSLAPLRAGLVFLGGAFSWVIGMVGWFNNPHGPEKVAVKKVYAELTIFIESVGTEGDDSSKQQIEASLKSAEELLMAGYIPWRVSETFKRLVLLNQEANNVFLFVIENVGQLEGKLPNEIGATLRSISSKIDNIDKNEQEIIPSLEVPDNRHCPFVCNGK